jgi:HD-GYP domain-containing protein (c-di-GMP phosphodiesterase class II)
VRHHQERYDGRTDATYPGYPDHLQGEEIPLGARIIAVVDAYDAMTTDRPYRRALTPTDACEELSRQSGSQFDPEVVAAFLAVLARRPWLPEQAA